MKRQLCIYTKYRGQNIKIWAEDDEWYYVNLTLNWNETVPDDFLVRQRHSGRGEYYGLLPRDSVDVTGIKPQTNILKTYGGGVNVEYKGYGIKVYAEDDDWYYVALSVKENNRPPPDLFINQKCTGRIDYHPPPLYGYNGRLPKDALTLPTDEVAK